jgi:diguanylate cyclase (GGDEF)-like protein
MMPSRNHLDYRIVFWLSLVASVLVAPFVLYHLVSGHWFLLLVTASTWIVLLGVTVETWWTRRVATPGLLAFAVVGSCSILLATYRLGLSGALWAYPAVAFVYYMLGTRLASYIMLGLCPGVVLVAATQVDPALLMRFAATIALTWLLSLAFSANTDRQRRELAELACRDPLTGAGNRREMEAELRRAVHLKERHGTPYSLIILDIDHFKRINDSYGHQTGDRVLIALTERIQERLRQTDQLFRAGGEEFVILLPETGVAQARQVADELAERVRSSALAGIEGITASLGVAELDAAESLDGWFMRADNSLYAAKAEGRDRVEVAG